MRTLADGLTALLADWRPSADAAGWPLDPVCTRTAASLPAGFLLHQVGLECPLAPDAPTMDLLVAARSAEGGAALLARAAMDADPDARDPAWRSLRTLLAHWRTPAWTRRLDDWWLEFDVGGERPRMPNLFFGPNIATRDDRRWRAWCARWLPLLLGETAEPALIADIERCRAALPDEARIFQLGAMRARDRSGLRLCLSHLYLDAVLALLSRLGIAPPALRDTLVALQPHARAFALQLDLPLEAGARIGLECYPQPATSTAADIAGWTRLLDHVVALGLCDAARRDALLAYPALRVPAPGAPWPDAALRAQALSGRGSAIQRRIHHIKLDLIDGRAVRAKAYLSLDHVWR
jgi:hypothetical protein